MPKLIIGLGNPGKKYEKTRHNVGFFIIDHLAKECGVQLTHKKFQGFYGEYLQEENEKIYLLTPQTMMNLSGECVAPWIRFLKIPGKNILVIHDELDFPLGKMRGQWAGSAGGHNGIQSIIETLGSKDFCRLRVGIGRPSHKEDVVRFVLSPFSKEEKERAQHQVQRGVEATKLFIEKGLDPLMQMVNRKTAIQ